VVHGNIASLLTLRPAHSPTDHLFVITDKHDYFTVSWDPAQNTIRNEVAAQDVADRFLRDALGGPKYLADPGGRMLGINVYEGLFLALPLLQTERKGRKKSAKDLGPFEEHCPIRMKELKVVDMAFLYGTDVPVLAVLHTDGNTEIAQLTTYKVVRSGGTCELQEWELKSAQLEAEAKMLIPVPAPLGGVMVVGEQTVVYLPVPSKQTRTVKRPVPQPTIFHTWDMVDRQRYLIGDETGNLTIIFLELDEGGNVSDIKIDTIGKVRAVG
jgi:DNA damage-binding protein 1